jgi:(1->4)-alpha-D-glucan 1-alpha-D-glucosylmutase
MRALGNELAELAALDRNARDFATAELLAALTEITACLDVYRTYVPTDPDRAVITRAMHCARRRAGTAIDVRVFNFLERVLAGERETWLPFVQRWQQFTGRVMAKGVEDTAFYNYNRLISLNEVGGDPGRGRNFDPVEEFHRRNERIARDWPETLNATSTHDTKRSEDVRARLNVLSEMPEAWERQARRWSAMTGGFQDANMEFHIYQTLVGAWPIDRERLTQYLTKAAREAKTHTSWIAPNEEYERSLLAFASSLLEREPFRASLTRFVRRIESYGCLNSLAQVVLKVMSPGVPDFYQGTELWDFSLVDPDNRRPVDYALREKLLRKLALPRKWTDERAKLFTTVRALAVRARNPLGDYVPLRVDSPHVVAFTRGDVLVVVPRLTSRMPADVALPIGGRWRNAFTDEVVEGETLSTAQLFAMFPVAILERSG